MIERPPIRHRREKVRSKIVSMVCFDSRRTDTLGAQVKSDVSKNILEPYVSPFLIQCQRNGMESWKKRSHAMKSVRGACSA